MKENTAFYTITVEKTGWHVSGYTRKAPARGDFLALFEISDVDRAFIENKIRENRRELFLIKSGKRSVILSTHLYFSSGLLFSAIIDEPVEFMTALNCRDEIQNLTNAPSADAAVSMKRLARQKSEKAAETLSLILTLTAGISVIPDANSFSLMTLLEETARVCEKLSGVTLERENGGVFGTLENYDISLATAFLITASAYVKRAGATRTGNLRFFSREEKLYISLECDTVDGSRAFEFDAIRYCADTLNAGFVIIEDKGKAYACLCSHRPDLSKIGLKNDIFFT